MEREVIIIHALRAALDVLDALVREAEQGNVQAAKLVLEVAGLIGQGRLNPPVEEGYGKLALYHPGDGD